MIKNILKNNYFKYTFFSFLDKGLLFLIPLLIPVLHSEKLYIRYEYILSIAIFVSIILDFGLKSYCFYGYKSSDNRSLFIQEIKAVYLSIIRFLTILTILGFLLIYLYFDFEKTTIYSLIGVRALYLLITYFLSSYFRLTDKPIVVLKYTIPANLIPILFIGCYYFFSIQLELIELFIGQLLLIYVVFFLFKTKPISVSRIYSILKSAIKFSWPTFISLLISTWVANYAKIYANDNLSEFEMFNLSINQRVTLIIFLIHTIFISYYSKELYLVKKFKDDFRLFKNYFLLLIGSILSAVSILFLYDYFFNKNSYSIISLNTVFLFIYTLFWVIGAYFEVFISRVNKTKQLPIITIVSGIVYLLFLIVFNPTLTNLTLSMAIYSVVYFLISITIVYYNKYR